MHAIKKKKENRRDGKRSRKNKESAYDTDLLPGLSLCLVLLQNQIGELDRLLLDDSSIENNGVKLRVNSVNILCAIFSGAVRFSTSKPNSLCVRVNGKEERITLPTIGKQIVTSSSSDGCEHSQTQECVYFVWPFNGHGRGVILRIYLKVCQLSLIDINNLSSCCDKTLEGSCEENGKQVQQDIINFLN